MDAGSPCTGPEFPSYDYGTRRKSSWDNLDRFIPNRSAIDFDFAHFMLTGGKIDKEDGTQCSPSKEAYRKHLKEVFNMNRTRILSFKNKPPPSTKNALELVSPVSQSRTTKHRRHIPQSSERTLDAPDILDDFYLNLLDWSSRNILAIALNNMLYTWNPSNGATKQLVTVGADIGPITSVKWAPDGRHLAVGLNNSHIQLWDSSSGRLLRTMIEGHNARVGALDWNDHILTTGSFDSLIINNDVRIRSHIVGAYRGHTQEVCGLKWSGTGQYLASGGNDNLIYIWSVRMVANNSPNQWLHRFDDHLAAVKALSWCPFQTNLLATGGGVGDQCIKFWNTQTGSCLNSVNVGSQVCSLLWNKHEREILSSHGYNDNQLILWKYPSMVKIAELYGHTSRVLYMAQSPDGCTVASAAADETLRFWNVFGCPELAKLTPKANPEPFPNIARIR